MKNQILLLITLLSVTINSQGLKFASEDQISELNFFNQEELGFSGELLPFSYSLEKHVPLVLDQGNSSACVGFSTLYYALSTAYNVLFNYTTINEKYANAFDPYFIYSILNNSNDCSDGLYMYEALDLTIKTGAKKLFYPPFIQCDSQWDRNSISSIYPYVSPYRMKDYYYLEMDENVVENIKYYITKGYPIMFGASTTRSLDPYSSYNTRGVKSDGLWSPSELEETTGGHAMTVIGYNDYKFGGAFRVVNSWGTDYGDNGYIWIRYNDFVKYTDEVYLFELDKLDVTKNPSINQDSYTRYKFSNGDIYEGGKNSSNNKNNYGIYTFKNSRNEVVHSIGKFNNGYRDGMHVVILSDGLYSIIYDNGNQVSWEKLGFSGSGEEEEYENIKGFMESVNLKYKVRRGNEDIEIPKTSKLDF